MSSDERDIQEIVRSVLTSGGQSASDLLLMSKPLTLRNPDAAVIFELARRAIEDRDKEIARLADQLDPRDIGYCMERDLEQIEGDHEGQLMRTTDTHKRYAWTGLRWMLELTGRPPL